MQDGSILLTLPTHHSHLSVIFCFSPTHSLSLSLLGLGVWSVSYGLDQRTLHHGKMIDSGSYAARGRGSRKKYSTRANGKYSPFLTYFTCTSFVGNSAPQNDYPSVHATPSSKEIFVARVAKEREFIEIFHLFFLFSHSCLPCLFVVVVSTLYCLKLKCAYPLAEQECIKSNCSTP